MGAGPLYLQFAMRAEAAPALERLGLRPSRIPLDPAFHFELHEGLLPSGKKLYAGVAGLDPRFQVDQIGTLPAGLLAFQAITALSPSLIVNPGTAGAFSAQGAKIGDVYLGSERACFHSRRVPMAGFEAMGRGDFPVADTRELSHRLGLPTAVVSSGDSFDYTSEELRAIARNGAGLKEMEAAAIAWVAMMKGIPFIPLKAVTNTIDSPASTPEQFLRNLGRAVERLTEELVRVLSFLDGQLDRPLSRGPGIV